MIKIAICDAMESNRNLILGFCNEFLKDKTVNYEIQEYTSGETLLAEGFPDVLFMDTKMQRIDGILVKEILDKMHAYTKIVFVSNEVEMMPQAFGKNVYGFVKKEIRYEEFVPYITEIISDIDKEKNVMFCKYNHIIEKICLTDVLYIRAYGKYTKIYINGEKQYRLSDRSFGEWYLEMENKAFLCCHRSYLVNLFFIKSVGKEIELINGIKIPIGEKKKSEFWDSYKAYIRRKVRCSNR